MPHFVAIAKLPMEAQDEKGARGLIERLLPGWEITIDPSPVPSNPETPAPTHQEDFFGSQHGVTH